MPFHPGKNTHDAGTNLQGDMLRKSGAAHRMDRSSAIEGKTPDAQTTPPRQNVNLSSKASVS